MQLSYLFPRLIRRFTPSALARWLLRKGLFIRPGLETAEPEAAFRRYVETSERAGWSLNGRRIMLFGYGGNLALACHLLAHGAKHIVLSEKDAQPDDARNRNLLPRFETYLQESEGRIVPRAEFATVLQGDVRAVNREQGGPVDVVLSNSVYEHLDDVAGITAALAGLTDRYGLHLHFVDLRDHYFKYPFAMLAFSEKTWRRWLNPASNLNRYRLHDYRKVFEQCFHHVDISILRSDEEAFSRSRAGIRPEFLSGDTETDSATLIQILARDPR